MTGKQIATIRDEGAEHIFQSFQTVGLSHYGNKFFGHVLGGVEIREAFATSQQQTPSRSTKATSSEPFHEPEQCADEMQRQRLPQHRRRGTYVSSWKASL